MTSVETQTRIAGQIIREARYQGQVQDFVIGQGTALFSRIPLSLMGVTGVRQTTDEDGTTWMEFGFTIDVELTGNVYAGWMDAGNYARFLPEWTVDLVNWHYGKFIPCAVPVESDEDGNFTYWSRSINPAYAAYKTGAITCGQTAGDIRNNGFTSIVIAGVVQPLAHYPYDMSVPGTAAQLQADLIALGWAGASVTGFSGSEWNISIPSVNYTRLSETSYVVFPEYLIEDMFGALENIMNQISFTGNFVDSAGRPILGKQFARLKIEAGPRYDPYR